MRTNLRLGIGLLTLSGCAAIAEPNTDPAVPEMPGITGTSSMPMAARQTATMNQASTVLTACAYFRYAYGRWPKDIEELKGRVSGIDFSVFGSLTISAQTSDKLKISVSGGGVDASTEVGYVDFRQTEAQRLAMQAPDFKFAL